MALFITFFTAALWHRCPPYERIQGGMTKQEVRYILGHSARLEPIGCQGDWMLPRKLPRAEDEEEELWSTTRGWVKIAYDNRGKVVYVAVRNLNRAH